MSRGKKKGATSFTAAQFVKAIHGSGGIVTTIARRVGCSWQTAKKYITTYPTIAAAYKAESEAVVDMAEGILLKSIKGGNTQDAKWLLARLRRDKYSERQEVTGADGGPLTYNVKLISSDELKDRDE